MSLMMKVSRWLDLKPLMLVFGIGSRRGLSDGFCGEDLVSKGLCQLWDS